MINDFNPAFFKFFRDEVMGRFSKQETSIAILLDWYNEVWMAYSINDIITALKEIRGKASSKWQVNWSMLKKTLYRTKKDAEGRERVRLYHESKKPDNITAAGIREKNLRLAKESPVLFTEKYLKNPIFKRTVDADLELKSLLDLKAVV